MRYRREVSIVSVFDEALRAHADKVAVIWPGLNGAADVSLTYTELDRRARTLAESIVAHGVPKGSLVATHLDRSLETIVAFLGILKAGCAYVPLDPAYPRERIAFMLEDTGAPLLITQSALAGSLPETAAKVLIMDAGFGASGTPSQHLDVPAATDLAYVIYTSGSTGKPKGVMVPHRGVVRLVIENNFTPLDDSRVFLQLAPVSFDAATLEIWGPLLNGGTCVLYPACGVPEHELLRATIERFGVTTLWLTASLFNLIIERAPQAIATVREVLAGGESLSVVHVRKALELLPNTQLVNGYGPTESTTFTCCYRIPRVLAHDLRSIPIGTAIAHTEVFILDEQRQPVKDGEIGDLYVGGDGLASGYLNRADLTAERFVKSSLPQTSDRLYATGDRVRRLPDGNIEFCGRLDDQVKISGHRIELGEIETALGQIDGVRQVVVLAREDTPGDKRLVAYVVGAGLKAGKLRSELAQRMPAYMIPAAFVMLDALPLSPTGKVERRALPKPGRERPELEQAYAPPRTPIERVLVDLWCDALELESVGIHDRFFELGGTSLAAMRFVARLGKELAADIPIVAFFDAPTVADIAAVLDRDFGAAVAARFGRSATTTERRATPLARTRRVPSSGAMDIAVIGLAGRFPGARNARELWQNLRSGRDASRALTADDLLRSGLDPKLLADPDYVARCFVLEDADAFDASFFGFTPREAELMDPQQRVFLECAYAALEDAGYDPSRFEGRIGVFGGVGRNPYLLEHLARHPDLQGHLIEHSYQIGNERDFPSMHVAYKLNLRGPAVNVQTACSTSGVALHFACSSLREGDCDMALVGGAKVLFPHIAGYPYVDGGALAADGCVRAFDAKAGGMVRGSGAGFVVVKPLADALRDGDNVRAVIRATAINNDGGAKIGFAAPSVQGQADVIAHALTRADLPGDAISYVETHGTGTPLGDPIEVAGLTRAFRHSTDKRAFCAIGSVKTNIGHLDAGAMAAGLIKTVLALEHEELPPSLHFETPNPQIDFANSPFFVNAKLRSWPRGSVPRRAGVSSFGLGGTNAHIIVEEAPLLPARPNEEAWQLVLLSAKTATALSQVRSSLAERLEQGAPPALADVAFTLGVGRRRHANRAALVARNAADAAASLRADDPKRCEVRLAGKESNRVVFMFPGGGAQYVGMARGLRGLAPFDEALARCAEIVRPLLGLDLLALVYPADGAPDTSLDRPFFALPALFSIEYAIAQLLFSFGIAPAAMIGHSMGEYTAACLSGVMTLEGALGVVTCRGRLFEQLPRGSMLSVPLSPSELMPYLTADLSIAAINRPTQSVASGPVHAIEALAEKLEAASVDATRIHIDVAAHSELVSPILGEFAAFLRGVELRAPTIPFVSNVTGTWITESEARDPDYWVRHLRGTVRFADGIDTVLSEPGAALVEIGPGRTLSTFAKNHPACDREAIAATVRHPHEVADDHAFLLRAVGRLWLAGLDIDHQALQRGASPRRVSLPTYPFERKRYIAALPERTPSPAAPNFPMPAAAMAAATLAPASPPVETPPPPPAPPPQSAPMTSRKDRLITEIARILADLSGMDPQTIDPRATFLELGFDSLFLTQANGAFRKRFGFKTTVRQLLEKAPGVGPLAEFLDRELPPSAFPAEAAPPASPPATATAPSAPQPAAAMPAVAVAQAASPAPAAAATMPFAALAAPAADAPLLERLIQQQLSLMHEQLAVLRGAPVALAQPVAQAPQHVAAPVQAVPAAMTVAPAVPAAVASALAAPAAEPEKKANKESPWQAIEKRSDSDELSPEQQAHLDTLIAKVVARAKGSKAMTQEYRKNFADPRTVQGFRMQWKDMVFPIVAAKSEGSKLWDVDGNEYIDLVNGYGATFLGHNPRFIRDAVIAQLERGVEIGPQNYLAGKLARLFCELTGNERAAFCNTGSEAVLAALRMARAVTGKDGIATFSGHYHGIFDEVLVKGAMIGGKRRTLPIAPGIPQRAVENTLVLKYGDMESLEVIRAHADELAMVLVEPIRSRNPELQPVEFVRALRKLTEELGIALLFDEMVTGFRAHPGGMQAVWGIRADLATYGKVVGGGFPIGVVAGKARFMDALDGGFWQYGDKSVPEADMTWFAGTFVRHPVAMAAAYATLTHLKEQGPELQARLSERTAAFAGRMNEYFQACEAPLWMEHFSSFVVLKFTSFQDYSQLLFYHLHNRGIFTYEGRPAFFTTAHSDEDFAAIERALRESVEELQRVKFLPGTPLEREPRVVPMSEGQQEIWLATRFGKDASCAFNLASTLELSGKLRVDALRSALKMLVKRHEALRCVPNADGQTQRVMPVAEVPLPFTDLSALTADRQARLEAIKQAEVTEEFDLDRGPLFRAQLIKLAEDEHLVIVTAHHLIADGWSCGVICRELGKLYAAACDGKPHGLPPALAYSDWIEMNKGAAVSADRRAAEEYWVAEYSGSPIPVLDLPTDRPRPAVKTFAADRISLKLDDKCASDLRKMAGKQGATLFAGVLAGFHVLLARLSGQADLVVGFSLAGQSDIEGRELVGHCVQFLPLRLSLDRESTFGDHVKKVRGKVFDAFEHKNFTFGTLIKRLNVPRDPSRVPLMSVAFNLDPNSLGIGFHDLKCTPGSVPRRFENFDIFFNLVESQAGLEVQCTFNLALFDRDTMRRRLESYRVLLEAAIRDASIKSADLPLLTEGERQMVLVEFNRSEQAIPTDLCAHELFERHVGSVGNLVAVRGQSAELTYAELDRRANQLAHYLVSRGAVAGRRVGVSLPRCPELVVALLGVLKAGAAYVPIDPSLPEERIEFMLSDAGAEILLTHSENPPLVSVSPRTVLVLDRAPSELDGRSSERPAGSATPESLAYVAYTSGSTGKPKGVMVHHRALVHYLSWAIERYDMTCASGSPVHSSIGFDLTITSLFGPLAAGRTVTLLPDVNDVGALARVLEQPGGFSVVKLTPAHLGIVAADLPKAALASSTHAIVVGGEQLEAAHVAAFRSGAKNVKIFNEYGPTETTVGCAVYLVDDSSPLEGPMPIGRPAPNNKLYVLDERMAPVPIGVVGELYIGGPQVALGYLNQPELTAQRFLKNPFDALGSRLYKTGDLARHRPSGELEFLGRIDKQVKIRGYRIELGEVEATLRASEKVAEAVVVAAGESAETRTLAAFFVPARAGESQATVEQKGAWKRKWDALYEAGSSSLNKNGGSGEVLDDLVLLRELSDKTGYEAEVQEGLDATFARLKQLGLGRVWAIGCGTGAELLRIAPLCGSIFGTDFAEGGIREIERLLRTKAFEHLTNVSVAVRDADDFAGVAPQSFDTVIINSVCQYFPDGDYFRRVLQGAARAVKPGGTVFIGDVQSFALLGAHHAFDQLQRSAPETLAAELSSLVERRIATEDELVVDPAFFYAFAREQAGVGAVRIEQRRGHIQNETTRFHYDVWLEIGERPATSTTPFHTWGEGELTSVDGLERVLQTRRPDVLAIADLPNWRNVRHVRAAEAIASSAADKTAADILAMLPAENEGIDPESLWALADRLPYRVDVRWTDAGPAGTFDAVFTRLDAAVARVPTRERPKSEEREPWWVRFANEPAKKLAARRLGEELKQQCRSKLPEYMVPGAFLAVDAIPLTANGKVDERALVRLLGGAQATTENAYVAPTSAVERAVADVFAEVLSLGRVGAHDNFFELGGHSLLGIQVVVRLRDTLSVPALSLSSLFSTPTVASLAEKIEALSYRHEVDASARTGEREEVAF